MDDKKDLHKGHRKRMMKRFAETGFSGFMPHEIVEMMLFYAIPRQNTNPLAHELLERYGSVEGILSAPPESLRAVRGISDGVINTLRFFRELNAYTALEKAIGVQFSSADAIKQFFMEYYQNEPNEVIRAALLDDQLYLARCITLSEGTPAATALTKRNVTKTIAAEGSNAIILAHNHPNGAPLPSPEDISVTEKLFFTLKSLGIELLDHIIVGKGGAVSMREAGFFIDLE